MDEMTELDRLLTSREIPEPDPAARRAALNLAVAAFEEEQKKNSKTVQGSSWLHRLTGKATFRTRRDPMAFSRRKLVYGGMATAAVALLVVSVTMQERDTATHSYGGGGVDFAAVSSDISSLQKIKFSADGGGGNSSGAMQNAPAPARSRGDFNSATVMAVPQSAPVMAPASREMQRKALVGDSVIVAEPPVAQDWMQPLPLENRDTFKDVESLSVKQVAQEPVSTFSVDVDTASYSFVRRMITRNGMLPTPDAVRIEEMINYFDYAWPSPETKEEPFKATVAVTPCPWKDGDRLIHVGIKGYDVKQTEKPRSNLVFLLDVSGSMSEPDKLPLVKSAMRMLVNTLKPEDTVAIVVYAGTSGTVLEPTKVSEKERILSALDNLQPGGSTAGAEGIRQAYALAEAGFDKNAVNRVILATDGDFNVGMSDPEQLKSYIAEKRKSGVFLSVLGFGQGNLNDYLMQELAQNGNGVAAYIDTVAEAQKVLVDEASSTLFPIAKDVKIQIEFNPAIVSEYRLIGYETRALRREDFNNDKVDAGDIGSGHTVTAIYEVTPKQGGTPLIDPSRYAEATPAPAKATEGAGDEYAFVKIRYKLPDQDTSKLITRPVTHADDLDKAEVDRASPLVQDIGWATAVAAFGEILKGSSYTGSFTLDQVEQLATMTKGEDPHGERAEFLNMVRIAKSLKQ